MMWRRCGKRPWSGNAKGRRGTDLSIDNDKIDEAVLAILYLEIHEK